MAVKRKGLGRGLGALINEAPAEPGPRESSSGIATVPVARVRKSPWQPRRAFDAAALEDLVRSVRDRGVLQPLLVRRVGDDFELMAGERRLRAAREAGLREVPVVVMEASDGEALELALIENLQREDLNRIEEAEGYRMLADRFGLTQEQIAERVGKGRATVANAVRLLGLPEAIRRMVAENTLSPGHAKALLGVAHEEEQLRLAQRIAREGLTVRAVERIVHRLNLPPKKPRAERDDIPRAHVRDLTERLQQILGTGVRIDSCKTLANGKKAKGRVEIDFYSGDELDRLLGVLGLVEEL